MIDKCNLTVMNGEGMREYRGTNEYRVKDQMQMTKIDGQE